jgi:hypothetical protein
VTFIDANQTAWQRADLPGAVRARLADRAERLLGGQGAPTGNDATAVTSSW